MITRNTICPYGCSQVVLRTEDKGKIYYSDKNGRKHHCLGRFDERNTLHGYVDDGCGCVERVS